MSYLVKGNVESALEKMFKNDLFQYVLKGPGESQECPEGTTVSEFECLGAATAATAAFNVGSLWLGVFIN